MNAPAFLSGSYDPASFRDPSGHVIEASGRIFRTVSKGIAAKRYEYVRDCGFLKSCAEKGDVVSTKELEVAEVDQDEGARFLLEHSRIPFISYPYEWSFQLLKSAALLHLDLHLRALKVDITLSDASAYNVQFVGPKPVFIDVLSFRPYREGELWEGHRQFCEQFLNPLLLRSYLGVPHNAWFRGGLEGISSTELRLLLPFYRKLSWKTFGHVVLPARLQAKATESSERAITKIKASKLSRSGLQGILEQLRSWIQGLEPRCNGKTVWGDYEDTHTYSDREESVKHAFIEEFVNKSKPQLILDLGCNTGEYSETALGAGAEAVVGFEFDQTALGKAYTRAIRGNLRFTPLYMDAANPSPAQGWRQQERHGFQMRAKFDALLALAFEHHLSIGRNIPFDQVTLWMTGLAPTGVIEFVQKADPTIQRMLAIREDIFPNYNEEDFTRALEQHARIIKSQVVSATGRRLFWYERLS